MPNELIPRDLVTSVSVFQKSTSDFSSLEIPCTDVNS